MSKTGSIWRFIPHYREVADDPEEEVIVEEQSELTSEIFRNRPWWKFFIEFEYRAKTVLVKKTRAEKKLLFKLHILITFYLFVGYWVKYLDQSNLTNAYVSGMKEDLGMARNEFVNAQSLYNAGAVIFQLLFMYLLPRVPLHYLVGGTEVLWGFITFAHYSIHNVTQLYALRFLAGAAESGYFMMWHFIFGSFFLPGELGFVGAIYTCGQMLGILSSGLIAGRVTKSIDGLHGIAGWRWLFIIDAVITIPVGTLGYFLTPGTPTDCYSLFLTDDEIRLARKRMKRGGIATKRVDDFFSKKLWSRVFSSWQIYIATLLAYGYWMSINTTIGGFALWLKSKKIYSLSTLNRLTAIPPAVGIFYVFVICWGSDFTHSRWLSLTVAYSFNLVGNVILSTWEVSETVKWFAFMLGYFSIATSPVIYGWVNDMMRDNAQDRAIVLMFSNLFGQQFRAWVDRLVYPTVKAPRYHKGYTFTAVNSGFSLVMASVALYFYKRQERKNALELLHRKEYDSSQASLVNEEAGLKELQ